MFQNLSPYQVFLQEIQNFSKIDGLLWLCFIWVCFKAYRYSNSPTLEPEKDASSGEFIKKNHKERLTTAAFYAPFVPLAAIHQPVIMILFMILMNFLALSEFLQITSSQESDEVKRKEKEIGLRIYKLDFLDKCLQVVGIFQSLMGLIGRLDVFLMATFASFFIIVTIHLFYLSSSKTEIQKESLHRLALHLFGFIWIPWTSSHMIVALCWKGVDYPYVGGLCAVMLWTSWIGDGAAYYVGSRFGRHKAFPAISPKKSWEGVIGTFVFSILLCLFFKWMQLSDYSSFRFPPMSTLHYIILGWIIAGFDVIGDIIESLVKRLGKVKDSGTFFTGHGGICDRLDSFYFVAPVTVYYLHFIVLGNHIL